MRTEWYVGQEYRSNGTTIARNECDSFVVQAESYVARVHGGFTSLTGYGGEHAKPFERTLVIVSDVESLAAAKETAQALRTLFSQRSVFGFYGVDAFCVE